MCPFTGKYGQLWAWTLFNNATTKKTWFTEKNNNSVQQKNPFGSRKKSSWFCKIIESVLKKIESVL